MVKKSILVFLVFLTVLGLIVSGCGNNEGNGAQSKLKTEKVLKVGVNADFAPFEFKDADNKKFVGFDVDLISAIAKEMDCKPKFYDMKFEELLPSLESGKVDLVVSGMTITSERRKMAEFSDPYYKTGISIIVRKKDKAINSVEDLPGKRIAVKRGTTSADMVKKMKGVILKETNSAADALQELDKGLVEAVVNDKPVNAYYIAKNGYLNVRMLDELIEPQDFGIAIKKGNSDLLDKVNQSLTKLRGNGSFDTIYKKWFVKH